LTILASKPLGSGIDHFELFFLTVFTAIALVDLPKLLSRGDLLFKLLAKQMNACLEDELDVDVEVIQERFVR